MDLLKELTQQEKRRKKNYFKYNMLFSIIVFLIALSILVLVHELGHFIVARKTGVLVEEFGFGLPPRIFGKKVGETLYSLNLLPFGGFVKLHGENVEEGITKPKRAFLNKSKKARSAIVVAGVIMNFLLAIFAFGLVYSFSGIPRQTTNVKIVEIASGSPSDKGGVLAGDIVKKVDGEEIASIDAFLNKIESKKGKDVNLVIQRDEGKEVELSIVPRENPPEGEGSLGVVISTTEIYFPPIWQRPFVGIYYGFKEAIFWGGLIVSGLVTMITGLFRGVVPKDVAGPVGIFALTSEAAKFGILSLINFIGILSVNLAILNVLPFPALDGGRLLFIGIESIIGKKVTPRVEAIIHTAGMVILLILIFAITAHDVKNLISAGSISGFLDRLSKSNN